MDFRWTRMLGILVVACQEPSGTDRAPPFQCPPGVSEGACHFALAGEYSGTLQDGGTWQVSVATDGRVAGVVTEANGVQTEIRGYSDAHGRILMTGGDLGFDGQVRIDGSLWGVWADAEWLRGFRGQHTAGPIVVDPSIPGTGGTGGAIGSGGTSGWGGTATGGAASGGGPTTGGVAPVDGWGACYIECRPADVAPSRECGYLSGVTACLQYATNVCGSNVVTVSRHIPSCVCFDPASGCVPDWW